MTIGKKFISVGAVLMGLTAILGGVTLLSLRQFEGVVSSLSNDSLAGVSACSRIESRLLELRGDIWKHIALKNAAEMDVVEKGVEQKLRLVDVDLQGMERADLGPDERKLNGRVRPLLLRYSEAWRGLAPLSRAGGKDQASSKYTAEVTPLFTALKESVQAETEFNRQGGARNRAEAADAGARTRSLTWSILSASLLIGSALLCYVVRGANRTLVKAVDGLRAGAVQVAASAAHISAASQSLAQGASEQAASLQETSASSEELTAMVCKNTENARRASTMVTDSEQQFQQANQAVEQMALAMDEVVNASGKISQILKLIDGIAFQTNVLSLNAAVEAARAGEFGLGFAVVADEVRNLAQRCAQASKDTETLIEESIAKARDGKVRMEQVGVAIRSITQQSAGVKSLVGEVNSGSQEQARGIEEIAKAVRQIEAVTEAVAANAEESASAAEQMSAQAQDLTGIANRLASMVGIAAPELNEEGLHICQQLQ